MLFLIEEGMDEKSLNMDFEEMLGKVAEVTLIRWGEK